MLLALLEEMTLLHGAVYMPAALDRDRSVSSDAQNGLANTEAYCAQEPWLLNDTIRKNIVFGSHGNQTDTKLF